MLSIAGHALKNKVVLAPLSGISDLPFRKVAAQFGAGMVVSEMVASEELARARPDVVRRAAGAGALRPFVIQLAGREARWMAQGAQLAEAVGADIIDINMGCPSKQVTGALSGSALMRDLDHALRIIDATVRAATKPVTLKMRLGWDRQSMNAPTLASRAQDAGIQAVTVHGRTRQDFFTGKADWRAVREVRDAVSIPLIVNGDIVDAITARNALNLSRADGVMIGRAALGRPWLPGVVASALETGAAMTAPSLEIQKTAAISHYNDMIEHYGAPLGVRMARKHLAAYIDHAPVKIDPDVRRTVRASICRLASPKKVEDALQAFYESDFKDLLKSAA